MTVLDGISWRWPDDALSWRIWDDGVVVYNDRSGDTHLLTHQQFDLLKAFRHGPRTLYQVLADLSQSAAMDWTDRPEDLVAGFEALGLLEQQTS